MVNEQWSIKNGQRAVQDIAIHGEIDNRLIIERTPKAPSPALAGEGGGQGGTRGKPLTSILSQRDRKTLLIHVNTKMRLLIRDPETTLIFIRAWFKVTN